MLPRQDTPQLSTENLGTGWQGSLDLRFGRKGNETQLIHAYTQAPLKIQRPFYPEGTDVCHGVLLHTAGGMVGGDRLSMTLQLEPQAHALITTVAANKIYRSNGLAAQQVLQIQVAEGACLEWLPQETIVFSGADFRQQARIELAPQATWIGWEITRLGRTASGEQFTQGTWQNCTEVWQQGRPLWIDPQRLAGGVTAVEGREWIGGMFCSWQHGDGWANGVPSVGCPSSRPLAASRPIPRGNRGDSSANGDAVSISGSFNLGSQDMVCGGVGSATMRSLGTTCLPP
ncbi:urease accessory protein UreD [Neosynechococcus sphagnicola]|uniref:urease accessory protein UreD n=1 Tax=Neosynechococcus sphagnicola TaxID=1501145 RepID=UPI000AC63514|nr:urease accessory protein UreD [Neosynechococcus sphagnicola]